MEPQNETPAQPAQGTQETPREEPQASGARAAKNRALRTRRRCSIQRYQPHTGRRMPNRPASRSRRKEERRGKGIVIGLCSVAAACLLFAGGAVIGISFPITAARLREAAPRRAACPPCRYPTRRNTIRIITTWSTVWRARRSTKSKPSIVSVIATGGSGSGVIMSEDGYIITNNHVVEDAEQVMVQLSDGTQMPAEIIGTDEQTDLAVLKVEPDGTLTAAEFGNSDELQPGEYAYARSVRRRRAVCQHDHGRPHFRDQPRRDHQRPRDDPDPDRRFY